MKIHFFELSSFDLLYCGKHRDRVHSNHYDIMLKKCAELLFFSTLETGIAVANDVSTGWQRQANRDRKITMKAAEPTRIPENV